MKIILWIDDDPFRYNQILGALRDTLVVFAHGFDQIQHYTQHLKYDMLLLDHDMPLMDGSLVIEKFHFNDVPIAIVSLNIDAATKMKVSLRDKGHGVTCIPIVQEGKLRSFIRHHLNGGIQDVS